MIEIIPKEIGIAASVVDEERYPEATSAVMVVVVDGMHVVVVTQDPTVVRDDGEITSRVQVTQLLFMTEATPTKIIGSVATYIEAEVNFVPMHVEEDGVVVVVAITNSRADQGGGKVPVMADFIVVVIVVDIVEDGENFVVVVKALEVVEEATVAEGEVVTS
jgi:hypothetical protein